MNIVIQLQIDRASGLADVFDALYTKKVQCIALLQEYASQFNSLEQICSIQSCRSFIQKHELVGLLFTSP